MKTFEQHINLEQETIINFCSTQEEIEINDIINDGFSTHDFTFTSGTTSNPFKISGYCEAKTRSITSTYYDGGVLLELNKFNSVMTTIGQERSKPERINDTIKGYYLIKYKDFTYLFDLEQVELGNIKVILCPKSSSSNGNNEYHYKPVFFLNPIDAIVTIKH